MRIDLEKIALDYIVNLPGVCDDPGDKYEQAIQGLFTAGTSGFRDLRKADEGRQKEKVGCKRGIEAVDRCRTAGSGRYVSVLSHTRWYKQLKK